MTSLRCLWPVGLTLLLIAGGLAGVGVALAPACAVALEPPPPGMIEQMRQAGTLNDAIASAKALGNNKPRLPKRGIALPAMADPGDVAGQIMQHYGESLDAPKSGKAVSAMSQTELSFAQLDLNHDRMVDERDVLALGFPSPKETAALPSMGTVKALCLFIDFPDYPKWFTPSQLDFRLFDTGDTTYYYRSLQWYYQQASYSNLTIEGSVYQHRASHNRTYYHANDNNWDHTPGGTDEMRRKELLTEAIQAADAAGTDFSQYDNDGDGIVDYYLVVYTGPQGNWSSFWWGYCFNNGYALDLSVDGVSFNSAVMSWQWEQPYHFAYTGQAAESPPNGANWDPHTVIHETGHALGLPDLYDYDDTIGPDGGCGGLDMMDHNWGDHNCFSKYFMGWLAPTIAFTNLNNEPLDKSYSTADAVVFVPGFDPVSPWSEYFMAQYRFRSAVDQTYPADGMLLWHVDSRVNEWGVFSWNNQDTSHKLLRLMEADGLEEIENSGNSSFNGDNVADTGDYYQTGKALSPASTPNSNLYNGTNPGITCNDFSAPGTQMTADFTMYTSNPPQVNITAPGAGSTVSGNSVSVTVTATDDNAVSKVQLLIDGQLVKTWDTWSSPSTYTWNTFVDFNKTLSIIARAWDGEDQIGSATISVTVSNAGVVSASDGFESGLGSWRVVNYPEEPRGTYTEWNTRTSPGSPPPAGSGKEGWVQPPANAIMYGAYEMLRSQRFDGTAFTHPVRVKFYYRCNDGLELRASTNNGGSWTTLAALPASTTWATYDLHFASLQGQTFYLALYYDGGVQNNLNSGLGANIDDFLCQQLPSDPPTVNITAPADGATISGSVTFTADATDDGTVTQVNFILNNDYSNPHIDNAAPWSYTRNTTSDDNHPGLPVTAIATDNDGTNSWPDNITVVLRNTNKTYPVYEDLESNANWSTQNSGPAPDWAWVSNVGRSGTHSYGWVLGGGGDGANWEGLWYNGHADLAADGVTDPQLRVYYKGNLPTDGEVYLLFYNSWTGFNQLTTFSADRADWYEVVYPMSEYLGYSGKIAFWIGNSNTTGTGVWIDDLRVENQSPYINSISPARGLVGSTQTISGQSFGSTRVAGSNVTFGGGVNAADADFVSWSNNQIQVKIPTGAVSGDVTVTVASQTSNGVRVAVLLAPPSLQNLVQQ